jgi:hypothetical protein
MSESNGTNPQTQETTKNKVNYIPLIVGTIVVIAALAIAGFVSNNSSDFPKVVMSDSGPAISFPANFLEDNDGIKDNRKKVLKKGTGESIYDNTDINFHYAGWLSNGNLFDSSWNRGIPMKANVGEGLAEAIKYAVKDQKVGAIVEIVVPYQTAFGDQTFEGVDKTTAVTFVIEIVSIV